MWLKTDNPLWAEKLNEIEHDVYHLSNYVELDSQRSGGEPLAYYGEHGSAKVLIPLVINPIPGNPDLRDAGGPYGYGGPAFSANPAYADVSVLLSMYRDAARDAGLVTSFLRLHPLLSEWSNQLDAQDIAISSQGQTVDIDLQLSTEELEAALRKNHRRNIKKLHTSGYELRIGHWDDYAKFQSIYFDTMKRVDASENYFFDKKYFAALHNDLSDHIHICTVLDPSGEIASGGLFFECNGIVQYHLGATHEKYLREAPSKLMFKGMQDYFKDLGAKHMNLGSGVGGKEDYLFNFKLGFGTSTLSFDSLNIIHNHSALEALVTKMTDASDSQVNADTNFFPPYRAT